MTCSFFCIISVNPVRFCTHRFLLLILLCFFKSSQPAHCQNMMPRLATEVGGGGLTTAWLASPAETQCAALAVQTTQPVIFISVVLPYGLSELAEMELRGTMPTQWFTLGAMVGRCGNINSAFTSAGLSASRCFTLCNETRLSIGIEYKVLIHTLAFYDKSVSSFSTLSLGLQWRTSWQVTLMVQNPEQMTIGCGGVSRHIPTIGWLSLRWQAPRYVALAAEVKWQSTLTPTAHFGLAFRPTDSLLFLAGAGMTNSGGALMSAGCGYDWGSLAIMASMAYDQQIGINSGAQLRYIFNFCGR